VIDLRVLEPDDWQDWRALRLAALEEAPQAFSSTLADWQGAADTEQRWRSRLMAVPFNVVAALDCEPAGMVSASGPGDTRTVELLSMWVAPFARGRGVGDALVEAVRRWAEEHDARRLMLQVAEGNEPAVSLYRRHGLADTGAPAAALDGICALEMAIDLSV